MGKRQNTRKNHENGSRKAPRSALGTNGAPPLSEDPPPRVDFESILAPIWCPFWLPCGSDFGVIFCVFFWNALGALSGCLGWDLGAFWGTFGSIFDVFLGSPREVKTVLPPAREHHFRPPAPPGSVLFPDTVPRPVPEHSQVHLFCRNPAIWTPFWGPPGTPFSVFFGTFFQGRFGVEK